MRNAALMTVGVVAALGAAFAVPALSDGPANYRNSGYTLSNDNHAEYVTRQTDAGMGHDNTLSRELTARDYRYGYDNGIAGTGVAEGNYDRDRYTFAQHTDTRPSTMALAEESIDVQARRLPDGSPVAVRGMVTRVSGKSMLIERDGRMVHARLPGMVSEEIRRGDDVTVYGHLSNRGDDIAVRTEAVLLMTSMDEGKLFMSPSRLESVNKRNPSVSKAEARNALDHYRFNFTPL